MSTRFHLTQYVYMLEETVREARESSELREAVSRFFALMQSQHDEHLVRSVISRFEERFIAREEIGIALVWFASESEGAMRAPRIRDALQITHRGGALVTQKSDPALISGIKMLYDGNYLIEASMRRDVENFFTR